MSSLDIPVTSSSSPTLADPCWSSAHGGLNPFRCRVELSAVTPLKHEVDCARGCRCIDVLQPCLVGSPPPAGAGSARRSHDDRTDQRHTVKSLPISPPTPVSATPAQASAQAHADAGRKNAPGCHQPIVVHRPWRHPRTGRRRQRPRRRPAPIAMPCSPASWSSLETRGTALAILPAGPGRGRRSETHDGRGGAPRGSGPRSVGRSPG